MLLAVLLMPSVTAYSLRHGGGAPGISPTRSRHVSNPVMLDSSSEIEALQLQIKILELQAQLQGLQDSQPPALAGATASTSSPSLFEPVSTSLTAVATTPVPSVLNVPMNPAPMPTVPMPAAMPLDAAATAAASIPSLPAFMDPKAGPQPDRCFGDECVKTVLAVPAGESNEIALALASGLGVFLGLPLAYLAVTKFVEFVNNRYDEIGGEAGGGGDAQAPARSAPSPYPWRNE